MLIRDRIVWGTLSDPRFANLDDYVKTIRQGRLPPNVKGGSIYENTTGDLPDRPYGYYREYDVQAPVEGEDRGTYRLVLGGGGDVYITGDHYGDFRQVVNLPSEGATPYAARLEADRNEALAKLRKAL
jgi:hypothetical protein